MDSVLRNLGLSTSDMVHKIIGNTCIVEYGIVQEVPSDGIVTVEMSASEDAGNIIITDCVLASIASNALSLHITPEVGDKVLVLYPRRYNADMFSLDAKETIVSACSKGYSQLCGIAILVNQFQTDGYRNYIDFTEGEITLALAYSEDDSDNLFKATIGADGSVALSLCQDKLTLSVNADAEIAVATNDDTFKLDVNKDAEISVVSNDVKIDVNKDNEVIIDTGKATVTIDKNGNIVLDAQGKYTIKNGSTNLQDVVDGLAKELENLTTVGSPATQATSPASKSTIATWRSTKLKQLFK